MARVWPEAADLQSFLTAAGMVSNPPQSDEHQIDLDIAITAAQEEFLRDTRIEQFLADANDTTRYYTVNGGPYTPIPPYYSITTVSVSSSYAETWSDVTLNTDYSHEPSDRVPIRALNWNRYFTEGPRRLKIVGKRGYVAATDMPARVFQAVLARAASQLTPQIAAAYKAGAVTWREGDVSEGYGSGGPFSSSKAAWDAMYADAIRPEPYGYRQVRVYGAGRV